METTNNNDTIAGIIYYNKKTVKGVVYEWNIEDRGRHGIDVRATTKDGDSTIYHLPPVLARVWDGEAMNYLIPSPMEGEAPQSVQGSQLGKPDFWNNLDNLEWAEAISNKVCYEIFRKNASENVPAQLVSPSIMEGVPPLMPDSIKPQSDDREAAKQAMAELGRRLSPYGRFIVGLALLSPFINEIGGESSYCHLEGEGGSGKSMLGKVIGSLFGDPAKGKGCFISFNSSRLGVSTLIVEYSYLPIVLDELNSSTAQRPMEIIKDLVMGAQRVKSSRSGTSVKPRGQWRGVVFSTGNNPPAIEDYHEMFDRRYFSLQADKLWNKALIPEDFDGGNKWWAETQSLINTTAGWAWADFTERWTPGRPEVLGELVKVFEKDLENLPMIAKENLGKLGQLGIAGTMWLSDWTGEPVWMKDTVKAGARILFNRSLEKTDVGVDFARALNNDLTANSGLYLTSTHGENRVMNPRGVLNTTAKGKCKIPHEGDCAWVDVLSTTVDDLTGIPTDKNRRLTSNENWNNLLMKYDGKSFKRINLEGRKVSVNTICLEGALKLTSKEHIVGTNSKPTINDNYTNIFTEGELR